jgi:hypothetical protein
MIELNEIDNELSKQFNLLYAKFKKTEFKNICEFKLENAGDTIPWNSLVYQGVYLIEIKNSGNFKSFELWVENFKREWVNEKYLKKFTPNLKKKRILSHSELHKWIPIYIGKSKNIGSRIHGHIYKELDKTTFALKLMARENLKNDSFRLSTININVENYDAIVPKIEWQLRERINPLIGKQ